VIRFESRRPSEVNGVDDSHTIVQPGPVNAGTSVPIETEPQFTPDRPIVLLADDYLPVYWPSWDVAPDGPRFLMVKPPENREEIFGSAREQTELVIVDNWFEELRRLAPPDSQE
jgi:hypothetical protein